MSSIWDAYPLRKHPHLDEIKLFLHFEFILIYLDKIFFISKYHWDVLFLQIMYYNINTNIYIDIDMDKCMLYVHVNIRNPMKTSHYIWSSQNQRLTKQWCTEFSYFLIYNYIVIVLMKTVEELMLYFQNSLCGTGIQK